MESLRKKKVLVTGAGGFIGSHLCEELVNLGALVTAMVHYNSLNSWGLLEHLAQDQKKQINVVLGNIEDPHFVDHHIESQDVVFHLAALIGIPYSYVAPLSYVKTNIEGTLNVLEAAKKHKTPRLICTSTSETYGTAQYTPIDEKHPLQGQSPYSASKISSDKIAESYHLSFGLPVVIVRPFNTFGPRQSARAIIPTIISQALWEDSIRLGSLSPIRDFTYVKDTVNGFIKLASEEKTIGQVVNLGTGKAVTVSDLAQTILEIMNCKKPVVQSHERVRPEKSEVQQLLCDNTLAKQLVGWQPTFTLKQGLKETVSFVEKNRHLFKSERYTI